jgi:pimeloyl-ACP methyl ester carboxylesterase
VERVIAHNGNVELSVEITGEGPTLVLLHGWPDTSVMWRDVARELLDAGYRVVIPDLRGCGLSSKPPEIEQYAIHHLVSDVVAILDVADVERATIVGHDWGANLAWICAALLPARVEALVALSVGHPSAFRTAGLEQQLKSWYFLLFAHEGVAERFLRQNDYEPMRKWLRHPHAAEVIEELERDGQMSAHLRWYQANIPPEAFIADPPVLPPITVPTLGIWSSGDLALGEKQMINSVAYCDNGFEYVRVDGVGHWLPIEAPHVVGSAIVNFLHSQSIDS